MDSSTNTTFTRDTVYYETVVFRAGNTIFRVPRNGFEIPGTVFETMFSLPTIAGAGVRSLEGSSDDNPIVLPVDEDKFRGFLGAMYPFSGAEMSKDNWIAALDLGTMWMFEEIRRKAIVALDSWATQTQDIKDAVLLAKKYRVLSWLKTSYTRLVQKCPLTIEELSSHPALDWETIARIFYIKKNTDLTDYQMNNLYFCARCRRRVTPGQFCPMCPSDLHISTLLEDVFGTEFDDMSGVLDG